MLKAQEKFVKLPRTAIHTASLQPRNENGTLKMASSDNQEKNKKKKKKLIHNKIQW